MRFRGVFLWTACFLGSVWPISAQLEVQLTAARNLFIQYEPIQLEARVRNITDQPIKLSRGQRGNWLDFIVTNASNVPVRRLTPIETSPTVLPPGEALRLTVNLTPHFNIRDTGPYDIRCVISTSSGKDYTTIPLRITLGRGLTIWEGKRISGSSTIHYSLLRFIEKRETYLYFRVEEPEKNMVFTTRRLGTLVSFTEPKVLFDPAGNVHILHTPTSQTYLHSVFTPEGSLISQNERVRTDSIPQLVQDTDGSIRFVGGFAPTDVPTREKLSDLNG